MTVAPAAGPASVSDAPTDEDIRGTHLPRSRTELAEHAAALLAVGWLMFPVVHGFGGRDAGPLGWGLLTVVPALVLTRPWRRPLPAVLAALVATAALAVCVFSPTGWYGASDAAGYVYAAALFTAAGAYARTPLRRTALAAAIAVAGVEEFRAAFVPWMGSGDPAHPMTGTFYWHNPYAAYLLAPALIGISLAVCATRPSLRVVGWAAAPLCVAGVIFSSSRATAAALAVGMLVTGVAAARAGRRTLIRFAAVAGVCVVVTLVLSGPPVFDHWRAPGSGAAQRSASGQSVATNGAYRTQFWREAVSVARDHPVVGGGYRSLNGASAFTNPPEWARSPQAHNGYLQALSDGGLVLGVPFVVAVGMVGAGAVRTLYRRRLRLDAESAVCSAAAVATLALLTHSAVDVDWSYPAAFAMAALVAALALAGNPGPDATPRRARVLGKSAIGVLLLSLAVGAAGARAWTAAERVSHNGVATPAVSDATLMARATGPFGSYRAAEAVLRRASQGSPVAPDTLRAAWRRTADAAAVNPYLSALRAQVLVLLGDRDGAAAAIAALLNRLGPTRQRIVARDVAVTLTMVGRPDQARTLLGPELVRHLSASDATGTWQDVIAADQARLLTDSGTRSCVLSAATALGPKPDVVPPSSGTPPADCSARIAAWAR